MSETKLEYWTPDPATVLKLYTEMEKGQSDILLTMMMLTTTTTMMMT